MRLALPLCLTSSLLAACAQTAAPSGNTLALATNTRVDLASADAVMYLQSAHTGFLEAAPAPAVRRQAAVAPAQPLPEITIRPRHARPKDGATDLRQALAAAYDTNPSLNQARSDLRAADEEIAIARSNGRPTVVASVSTGVSSLRDVNTPTGGGSGTLSQTQVPTTLSLDITQPLFEGFRTRNATLQAESSVLAERARLSVSEQDILFNTALAFVDVRRFRGGVDLRQQEVTFLEEQLGAAASRLQFGEGTRTDIDQAEARLAEARATLADERASAADAEARFRELTGLDPARLSRDINVDRLVPQTLGDALRLAQEANPRIDLALHETDAAIYRVKTLEGEALPRVSLSGRLRTDIDTSQSDRTESAEVRLNVDVPLYQGGRVSAQVRQAKEQLGSARIGVDIARDEVRSDVASAWASYSAARQSIAAAEQSVVSARRALEGVLQELRVGQRTTLDALDAQRDLVRAQLTLLAALRQRDAAAFALLRGTGRLDTQLLGVPVDVYRPEEHTVAVRDRWRGMRTPDGR